MYPRHRFDSLTDGIFAVAMTLLVLDIHIPDGADPHSARALVAILLDLWPKVWPYMLSFAVLSGRWRALTQGRSGHTTLSDRYVRWGLIYLLLVTLVPFSTMVLGRFASLAPAVWLYSANLAALALSAWLMSTALTRAEREQRDGGVAGLVIFLLSAVLAVAISFRNTPWACAAFLLNGLSPLSERYFSRGRARSTPQV